MKLSINKYKSLGFSLIMGTAMLLPGCTGDFDEINTSKTGVTTITKNELPFLFSRALQQASYKEGTYQTAQNLYSDLYSQYFATSTANFQTDRYFMHPTWIEAHWTPLYTEVVPQLLSLMENTEKTSAEYALANIWWVFSFHRLTDHYGPIPYTKAGISAPSVGYDSQKDIYFDFFKRLDEAVATLKSQTETTPYGEYDIVYQGDVSKWIRFANTLRLRLALRISDVEPEMARQQGETAIAAGVFTSLADEAVMKKSDSGNDFNGLATIAGWNEFRMSAAMESVLKGYEDPRLSLFFQPAFGTKTYEGIRNGLSPAELGMEQNNNNNASNIGTKWVVNTGSGSGWNRNLATPQTIMTVAEAYFLLAEATIKGWETGGSAKDFYEQGIRASMNSWSVDAAVTEKYIQSSATPVAPGDQQNSPALTNIPVKWGATESIQREQIATQKWLAIYPDGQEAWAEFRRTGYPKLYPVVNSVNDALPKTSRPRRIPFLQLEYQNNSAAMSEAVSLLGGPDSPTTPLWWDKN